MFTETITKKAVNRCWCYNNYAIWHRLAVNNNCRCWRKRAVLKQLFSVMSWRILSEGSWILSVMTGISLSGVSSPVPSIYCNFGRAEYSSVDNSSLYRSFTAYANGIKEWAWTICLHRWIWIRICIKLLQTKSILLLYIAVRFPFTLSLSISFHGQSNH